MPRSTVLTFVISSLVWSATAIMYPSLWSAEANADHHHEAIPLEAQAALWFLTFVIFATVLVRPLKPWIAVLGLNAYGIAAGIWGLGQLWLGIHDGDVSVMSGTPWLLVGARAFYLSRVLMRSLDAQEATHGD